MQLAAGDERDENGVGECTVFGADEDPVFTPDGLPAQRAFRDVVRHWQAAIFEESLECLLLIERVADRGGHRRFVEHLVCGRDHQAKKSRAMGRDFLSRAASLRLRGSSAMVRSILNRAEMKASAALALSGSDRRVI